MSIRTSTIQTLSVLLIIIAIITSSGSLMYSMQLSGKMEGLSDTISDKIEGLDDTIGELASAESELASAVRDLGEAVGRTGEEIAAIEKRIEALEEVKPTTEKVITVGAAISLTGIFARLGTNTKEGYEFAIDYINSQGGFKIGDEVYKLKLIVYDDESKAETATKLVEKLITDLGLDYILGPYSTTINMPVSSITEKYGKPMIQGGGGSDSLYERGYRYLFGLFLPASRQAVVSIDLFKNLGANKFAFLVENDAYSTVLGEGTKNYTIAQGLEVSSYQIIPVGTPDISTELQMAEASGADVLLMMGHDQTAFLVVKQSKELDVNFKGVFLSIGPHMPSFREDLGKDAWYVFSMTTWLPTMEWKSDVTGLTTEEFVELFIEKFGHEPDYHAAVGAACVECFVHAFQHAEELSPTAVRKAIADIHGLKTLYYVADFGEEDTPWPGANQIPSLADQILPPGEIQFVWPIEWAEAEAIYPVPTWAER